MPLSNENAVWSSLKRALQREGFMPIKLADKSTVGIPDALAVGKDGVHWWMELKIKRRPNVLKQVTASQVATLMKLRNRLANADLIYYDPSHMLPWRVITDFRWDNENPTIVTEAMFVSSHELVEQYAPRRER